MITIDNVPDRIKKMWDDEKEELGFTLEDCTCLNCSDNETCNCAFDLYNTNNDCLWVK
jgi:hypothetical protein